jgi:aspartyl-tRNA(Asn)/glutamyl-tRNA(Gln) amidotransferase subunit A
MKTGFCPWNGSRSNQNWRNDRLHTRSVIRALHDKLAAGEFSCQELAEAYFRAVHTRDKVTNSYVTLTEESARNAAERAQQQLCKGEAPLLCGIPVALKDNLCTAGIRTTCCSKMLSSWVPPYNAAVWECLQQQGAVLLGKNNMDEFAMGTTCETSCFGPAKNPFDASYIAGGSSGGSAAAVGAGLAPYSLGSDTGGSIRQPASFCGTVGLKPTYGAVSRWGLVAYASSMDQVGPIAPTVEDAAVVFDAIARPDPRDETCTGARGNTVQSLGEPIHPVVGVAPELFHGVQTNVGDALEQAQKQLQGMGAVFRKVSLPTLRYGLAVYNILACAEASSNLARYDGARFGHRAVGCSTPEELCSRSRGEGFGMEVKRRILMGTFVLSADRYEAYYQKAAILRRAIAQELMDALTVCDVLLAPTAPVTALRLMEDDFGNLTDEYNVPANLAGLPALSVPCGVNEKGLPIGMQFIGRLHGEGELLRLGHAYEQYTQWQYCRVPQPPV